MSKLIKANFSRLFHSKIFWFGFLFMFGTAVYLIVSRFYDVLMDPKYAYPTADGLWFAGGSYFALIEAFFVSMWIGTDYSDGTVRNKLVVGHTRWEIYASNWVVCTVACLMMHMIYIVTVAGLGYFMLGPFETPVRVLTLCTLASIATVIAMSSLFVFIAMQTQYKSNGVVIATIMALMLIIGGVTIYSMLEATEYTANGFTVIDGQMVPIEPILSKNPDYVGGMKRKVFEFIMDFQPEGQMMQYGFYEALPNGASRALPKNIVHFPIYSLLITIVTSVGGWLIFRRTDLK